MKIIFIMGPTNSGKTTIISELSKNDSFHPVVIGKKLREIYPPEYFDGQSAPAKTDNMAFNIMCDGIDEAFKLNKIALVDGQPRNNVQYELCKKYFDDKDITCMFISLWAPRDERILRAHNRDGNNSDKLNLSLERMDKDIITLYDMIIKLYVEYDVKIMHFNTYQEHNYLLNINKWLNENIS